MNDTPPHRRPADSDPPMPSETELLAALAESEAEAGLFVSGDEIMRELHESIARMEGKVAVDQPDQEPGSRPRR